MDNDISAYSGASRPQYREMLDAVLGWMASSATVMGTITGPQLAEATAAVNAELASGKATGNADVGFSHA